MERFTISLDENLAVAFDALTKKRGYATRSEAVRDILRTHLQSEAEKQDTKGICVANLSYVYNHHERELAERLTRIQHAHHELTVSTMHAHLDHDQCIETPELRCLGKYRIQEIPAQSHGVDDSMLSTQCFPHGGLPNRPIMQGGQAWEFVPIQIKAEVLIGHKIRHNRNIGD